MIALAKMRAHVVLPTPRGPQNRLGLLSQPDKVLLLTSPIATASGSIRSKDIFPPPIGKHHSPILRCKRSPVIPSKVQQKKSQRPAPHSKPSDPAPSHHTKSDIFHRRSVAGSDSVRYLCCSIRTASPCLRKTPFPTKIAPRSALPREAAPTQVG